MKERLLPLIAVLLCATQASAQPHQNECSRLYEHFRALKIDVNRVARVENLRLERDVGRFELQEGYLYLCTPILQRVCAAIFVGDGRFSFEPPTRVEREQLYRFYEQTQFSQPIRMVFFVFADQTLTELEKSLDFVPDKPRLQVEDHLGYCLKYIIDEKTSYLDRDIAKALLNDPDGGFFYAHFCYEKLEPRFWQVTPHAEEEIAFLHRPREGGDFHVKELVCQFQRSEDRDPKDNHGDEVLLPGVESYKIVATLENNLYFTAEARMHLKALEHHRWLDVQLFPGAEVDSVWWEGAGRAEFQARKGNPLVWIECRSPFRDADTRILNIAYRGEFLRRVGAKYFQNPWPTGWYPRLQGPRRVRSSFDCTFSVPEQFNVVCVGELLSSQKHDGRIESHWVTSEPVSHALFNVGFFGEEDVRDSGMPTVNIRMSGRNTDDLWKAIRFDVVTSTRFFQELFGDCRATRLLVTDSGQHHGIAAHGYLDLGLPSDNFVDWWGDLQIFRAHEIAHQWWGAAVQPKTYHDQWLSEAFAQYSGLMYMKATRSEDAFFEKLKQWRERLMNNRNYLFGSGQEAGPIWLGQRTRGYSTRQDYDLVVYRKGAWVLHMLRCMLVDLSNSDESRFIEMMREFYRTYSSTDASTSDFQKIAEKHANTNLDWFFDQWVYGTDIPTYEFAYRILPAKNSRYAITCRVRQRGVGDDFGMYVPIQIVFENDQWAVVRAWIQGATAQFDLPLSPAKPKRVIFNPFESVLCRVKNDDW